MKFCEAVIRDESTKPMLIANTRNTTDKIWKAEELGQRPPLEKY